MTGEAKQYTMTDLCKITDRVIALIPADFEQYEEMVRDLTHFRRDLVYKSLGQLPNQWQILCDKLNYWIGDTAGREWAEKIVPIVRGDE